MLLVPRVWTFGMATSWPVVSFLITAGVYSQSIRAVLNVTVESPSAVLLVVETMSLSLARNSSSRSSKVAAVCMPLATAPPPRFHLASVIPELLREQHLLVQFRLRHLDVHRPGVGLLVLLQDELRLLVREEEGIVVPQRLRDDLARHLD